MPGRISLPFEIRLRFGHGARRKLRATRRRPGSVCRGIIHDSIIGFFRENDKGIHKGAETPNYKQRRTVSTPMLNCLASLRKLVPPARYIARI
jgi:hypothetical protein